MSLELTKQVEAAIRARQMYEQFENRLSNYGALRAFMESGAALLPKDQLEELKSQQNLRDVVFPVLTKQSLSVITANACSFVGVEANSAKPTFSSVVRGFAVRTFPRVAANNYISEADQYANQLVNGVRSISEALDTLAVSHLEANRSTGLADASGLGVAIAANAYQFDAADENSLYIKLPAILELNDADTGSHINIMHTNGRAEMLKFETNAVNNAQNLAGALNGSLPSATGYRHYTSKRVTNGSGVKVTHYVQPFGSIGLFSFVDSEARAGITGGVNNKRKYTFVDPILGIEWAVTEEPVCADLSGTYGAGYEECNGTQYRFMANFSFMSAYSSDATKAIHKVEVLSA